MNKLEQILDIISHMSEEEMVDLHNSYCSETNNTDRWIYHIDEFDDLHAYMSPFDLACKVVFGDFRPCDSWWTYDGYANIESLPYVLHHIWIEDIADYAVDHDFDFGNDDIRDILDEKRGE